MPPRPVSLSQALKAAAAGGPAPAEPPAGNSSGAQISDAEPSAGNSSGAQISGKKKRGPYSLSEEEKAARQERLARARETSKENTKRRQEIRAAVRQRMGPLAVAEKVELEHLKAENEAGLLTATGRKRLAHLLDHLQKGAAPGPAAPAAPEPAAPEPAAPAAAVAQELATPEPAPRKPRQRRAAQPDNALIERLTKMEIQQQALAAFLKQATEVGRRAVAPKPPIPEPKSAAPAPKTSPKVEEEDPPPPRITTFDLSHRGSSLGF